MVRSPLLSRGSIATHVVVVMIAAALVSLGFWQLSRLAEVQRENARLAERLAQEPVEVGALADGDVDPAALEYRRVEVTGTYVADDEVLQRSRQHQGRNGYHALTPLAFADGRAILVRRGWVPFELDEPPVPRATPPDGEVTVTGFLTRSEPQPSFGPRDPATGQLQRVFRADVARIGQQVEPSLFPLVLHLEEQTPVQSGRLPIPADRPALDEGNHLSYAIQWFSFATIALVGYVFALRRRHRETRRPTRENAAETRDHERVG